ncbi:MAG: YSC84-related protein [Gammaproteobacteria bacterium]|jgi:lipid-binding SYLF domain-containing protein
MTHAFRALLITLVSSFAFAGIAAADDYADTVQLFKNAGQSGTFFDKAYGYAVFPTVGKGALGIGGARGKGRVYAQGKYVGDATLTQVSIGFQAGGQAYSQIVFFEDERAYREFTSGEFGFGAGVSAVAITAAASATASTTGNSAGISGGKKDATTTGEYFKGMAVFTIAKGGLMYEAALAGQKFSFRAKKTE